MLAITSVSLSVVVAIVLYLADTSITTMGILSGAVTNTPGLGSRTAG